MAGRIRVFIACSLDGFIAGPNDDLSWLPPPSDDPADDHGYTPFMAEVGALLMGRRTFDVVRGFGGAWPYGERPVLVATRRPLGEAPAVVRAVEGGIDALLDAALAAAGGKDVYVDGGDVIRQALDAGRIDEMVVTVVPVVLGAGHPLFAGVKQRRALERVGCEGIGHGMVQLRYRVAGAATPAG